MKKPHYTSDYMLDAAFKFRQTNLWEIIDDGDIFAVQLPSGQTGYCIVMGAGGTYYGLGLYRGAKGFSTYLRMINQPKDEMDSMTALLTYDVINCNFSQASEMNFGLKEPVREFSRKYGRPIPRKNGWPEFVRYQPFRCLAPVNDEEEGNDIATALLAAVWLAEQLNTKTLDDIGIDQNIEYPSREGGRIVPLIVPDGADGFHLEKTALPAFVDFDYPEPEFTDAEAIEKIKSLPKGDSIEVGSVSIPIDIANNPENTAIVLIPVMFSKSGMMLGLSCDRPYDAHPEDMLMQFVSQILEISHAPSSIICTDDLTTAFFRDFCIKTKTPQFSTKRTREFTQSVRLVFNSVLNGF